MRIVYLSHVDVAWIKQRPQFLAEELTRLQHSVTYVYPRAVRRAGLAPTNGLAVTRIVGVRLVPQRLRSLGPRTDVLIQQAQARSLPLSDWIWVCHPRLWPMAQRLRERVRVAPRMVYDCMDRVAMFATADARDSSFERELAGVADVVLASSGVLLGDMQVLRPGRSTHLIPNGVDARRDWLAAPVPARDPVQLRLGYFGTISEWFDWATVLGALAAQPGWSIDLWGPVGSRVPVHPRVHAHGSVAHSDLERILAQCDVMVMPFLVDPLIEAVDPVKVYEYVSSGRPVVIADYPVVRHFAEFVEFYPPGPGTGDAFARAIERAVAPPGVSPARVVEFTLENSWESRAAAVGELLADS